jgi:hypothetical protein
VQKVLATQTAFALTIQPTPLPTFTAAPTNFPTITLAPTLNMTPTFVTAAPETPPPDLGIITVTPFLSSDTPAPNPNAPTEAPQFSPTPAPTVALQVTLAPTISAAQIQSFQPPVTNAQAFALTTGVNGVGAAGVNLPGDAVFIAYNPVYPASYARVDSFGMLYLSPPPNGPEGTFTFSPFYDGFRVPSAQENKNRAVEIRWSPNGQMMVFRIVPPPGTDPTNAGVWFWQPDRSLPTDPTYQLLRECPPCTSVNPINAGHWISQSMEWSNDNVAILVTLNLPDEGRQGIAVIFAVRDSHFANNGPTVIRYDYGHWANDGQRIVVSGRDPNGQVVFGMINRDGSNAALTQASALGLAWVQDAVEGGGGYLMLGSPNGQGGPMQLFSSRRGAITGVIGDGAPSRVEWSPDRTAVYVVVNGRQYVARTNGQIQDVTGLFNGQQAVNWATVGLPPNSQPLNTQPPSFIPSGVIEGSQYTAGQQLRVYADGLNLRAQPTTSAGVIGVLARGDYVAILAGPVNDSGVQWWQVQTAGGQVGWVAGALNGVAMIGP